MSVFPCAGVLAMTAAVALSAAPASAQVVETEIDQSFAPGALPGEHYGSALDLSDDWIVVGASGRTSDMGGVYVFNRPWSSTQLLAPPPGDTGRFGDSLDLDGNTLVIGEPKFDSGRGRVHVYEHNGVSWSFRQSFEGAAADDRFGTSVSVDESAGRMVIGIPRPSAAGSIQILERVAGTWIVQRSITPVGFMGNLCGYSVAVEGGVIAAGVPLSGATGKVHVWEGSGLAWQMVGTLVPSVSGYSGYALAMQGGDLFVGSPAADGSLMDSGAVAHYQRGVSQWNEVGVLRPPVEGLESGFGSALALAAGVLVVGVPGDSQFGPLHGAVVQYRCQGGTWVEQQTGVPSDLESKDGFATAVAVHDGVMLVGAARHLGTGSVYEFSVPDLSLSATPAAPSFGDWVTVEAWGGAPGQLVGLFVVGFDAAPMFLPVQFSFFSVAGAYGLQALHNSPLLLGHQIDVMAIGRNASGKAILSPVKSLQF